MGRLLIIICLILLIFYRPNLPCPRRCLICLPVAHPLIRWPLSRILKRDKSTKTFEGCDRKTASFSSLNVDGSLSISTHRCTAGQDNYLGKHLLYFKYLSEISVHNLDWGEETPTYTYLIASSFVEGKKTRERIRTQTGTDSHSQRLQWPLMTRLHCTQGFLFPAPPASNGIRQVMTA